MINLLQGSVADFYFIDNSRKCPVVIKLQKEFLNILDPCVRLVLGNFQNLIFHL
jgi:hypothetical protein